MASFLSQLVEKITENGEVPLENTTVIVPNKRAKRELFKKLTSHFTKPVFAPNILSVNEFIESLSSLKKIEKDELLIRLYEICKMKNMEKCDDFASFLVWAPLFLNDINEIDIQLADAPTIFSNLSEIKTLETSFGKENLTETQRQYLYFYTQLASLYIDFTKMLKDDKLGYEGMIYRDAATIINHAYNDDNRESRAIANNKSLRYIFAGFNALTPAELEIFYYFYVRKNAEIYFDIDHFYDEKYGIFIDEILQKLKISEIYKANNYKDIPKQISCIGAPKRTAQIYQAIEILNDIKLKQGNLNDTALVFADESMLLPFLHIYNCENANITMGYQLNDTLAAQQLLQLIEEEKQNNILQKPLYNLKTQGFEFLNYLKNRLPTYEYQSNINFNSLIINLLCDVYEFLKRFFPYNAELDFAIAEYFLKEKLNTVTIPFRGTPHEGLQIMGLLETRMLDFKNVIMVSMNEGVLPKGASAPSLLLYDVKKHFNIPTYQHTDAIFGYHFFRLLQRAENLFLIYDNDSTNKLAEKSRFIEQLEFEIKKQQLQESIHFTTHQFIIPFSSPKQEAAINITKTLSILEKLSNYCYSPTGLSTYIQCPLRFYWKYINEITIPEVFDVSTESSIIGTIIHNVLDEIFKKLHGNENLYLSILAEYSNDIDETITRFFRRQHEVNNEDIFQGKLFLAFQVVKKSILDYMDVIRNEWKNSVYQIICTEIRLNTELNIDTRTVHFSGKADRVEMRDNKITILDYKTGKVETKKLRCKAEEISFLFTDSDFQQLFQLLCYAYLYQNDKRNYLSKTDDIQCGIIAFQELYKQNEDYIYYAEIDKERILNGKVLQLFEDHLKALFSDILDETTPFTHTHNQDNCNYCEYSGICNR